jgi:allophanate hydrolase subunit 2
MSLATATSGFTLATTTLGASIALITPKLTTTFTPKVAVCTGNHLTMLANREFEIWMNMPVPVPGTTITDCYPDQFMQSFLSAAGGITQPAFDPLVCPQSYSTVGPYTSNYIACCPRYVKVCKSHFPTVLMRL